jgi:hypothetical protein
MAHVQEGPMSTAQSNALVVALIYERAGEPTFRGSGASKVARSTCSCGAASWSATNRTATG